MSLSSISALTDFGRSERNDKKMLKKGVHYKNKTKYYGNNATIV